MNRHSKRIKSSLRPVIENIKCNIRSNTGRGFDGIGSTFTQAVKEMKVELEKQGKTIQYDRIKCSYFIVPLKTPLRQIESPLN